MRLPKRLDAVGRVLGYWRAERRTIRHGLTSLVVATVGEVAAGVALGSITGTLEQLPGLLVLLPAANSVRGSIFGAMTSRLGTSIHTGLFEPSRKREGALYQNIYAATVLTFAISFAMGVLAKGVSVALGVQSVGVADLVVISVLGGLASSALVGTLAVVLSLAANTYNWDLDSVATPVITAIGDVATIPALFAATYAARLAYVTPSVGGLIVVVTIVVTVAGLRTRLPEARRAVRESLPIVVATGTISLLAGVVVESRIERFLSYPALLVLVPALMSNTGALGATLSSRLASKLHLGALEPRGLPQGLALLDSSIVALFGLWVFVLVGVGAHYASVALGFASPGLGDMVQIGLLAGLMTTSALMIFAYYIAVLTYRVGLDPDNHGVPLVTSASDLMAVLALITSLVAVGLA